MQYSKKYPKLKLLLGIYLVTFFVFSFLGHYLEYVLVGLGPLGILIAGVLYTYSFTGSIGTAAFIVLAKTHSPLMLATIGGIGAGFADVSILKLVRKYNLTTELEQITREQFFTKVVGVYGFLRSRVFLCLAGIITMASPFPDEIGIILIQESKIISMKHMFVLGAVVNAIGIYIIASLP